MVANLRSPRPSPTRRPGNYEEYHPYGGTAWWAGDAATVSQKRYRYTGMERDEETGLQCHGLRYYAPWLGRWMSADPIGLGDAPNRYSYVRGNPVQFQDRTGLLTGVGVLLAFIPGLNEEEADPSPPPPPGPVPAALPRVESVIPPVTESVVATNETRRQPEISSYRPPIGSSNLEHGPLGPSGTLILGGRIARAAVESDSSYIGLAPVQRKVASLVDTPLEALVAVSGARASLNVRNTASSPDIEVSASPRSGRPSPDAPVAMFRVQGGTMPKRSQERIQVAPDGNVSISKPADNLAVSLETSGHSEYFATKRQPSETVMLQVPYWYAEFMRDETVPQSNYTSALGTQGGQAPKFVDPTKAGGAHELPAPWVEWTQEVAVPGSAVRWRNE